MGATYTRQSSSAIVDGGVIEASDLNAEFNQILSAFAVTSGHTHDGTAAEGGPITKLLGTAITIGDATAGTDIAITFDGESADGVLTWKEDEDYFEFSDDLLLATTEKLQFRDTAIYINSSTDGQLDLVADTEIQIAATTVDINGAVDISGTLTLAGTTLAETISDTVGAMVSSNTETNITVTYDDSDNTLDFVIGTLNQNTTGTAATVTDAAQSNITSLGTLTTLTVDNVIVNGSTIGHTSDTDLITVASGIATIAGEVSMTTLDIGGTNVTSTAAELNILDGVTASAADINLIDGITNGTVIASKAIITDANKDITGGRNITITGELDAATLDISGDVDVDGTLEADAITVNGTALASVIAGTTVTNATTAAVATTVTITDNESTNENNAIIFTAGGDLDGGNLGLESDGDLKYNPSTGTLSVPNVSVSGTFSTVNSVTMDANNAVIFEGSTADAHETTLTSIDATGDRTISLPNISGTLPVLAAVSTTQITSTPEELNILDGVTSTTAELNILDGVTSTATELNLLDGKAATNLALVGKQEGTNFTNSLIVGHSTTGTLNSATGNTGVGIAALESITSGDDNTVVGFQAGDSITAGGKNTYIGTAVGRSNNGNENTAVGMNSLLSASGSYRNVAIGQEAGKSISSGNHNVVIGRKSGDNITSGDGNVIIGEVDADSATGNRQLKIGTYDGSTATTWISGDSDGLLTIIGGEVIPGKLEGTNFTGSLLVGHSTTGTLSSAERNTGVGINALESITSGDGNTALGNDALSSMRAGLFNTAIGDGSGENNTGNENVFVGAASGFTSVNAYRNTLIGRSAGFGMTTGTNNLLFGHDAGKNITSGSGNIIIGTNLDIGSATGDHQLLIGNYNDSSTVNWITGDSSGNLIFPAEVAAVSLDISGDVDVDGTLETDALSIASTAVTSTAAELNLLDGGATVGTTAIADGDGIIHNDAGTMRVTTVQTFKTYFTDGITASAIAADDISAGDAAVVIGNGSTNANITIDSGADIILDADGGDFSFKDGGTEILKISNSSSDVVIKPIVDAKDIIFQQRDGTEVARIEDNGTFNVVTSKLAINGTAVTSTAAELNILDGVTSTAAELNILDGVTSTATELNILDGVTSTTAELNYSDLATLGTTAASKVITADANNLTTVSGAMLNTEDTLSDGANVAWNVINSPVAKVTLAGNRNLSAPSGSTPAAGQFVSLLVIQDGTGSRTLTFNAVYEFTTDTAPTLTTTANLGDIFVFRYNGAKWLEVGRNLALTLS